jgi:hypothetical protein
MAFWNHKKTAGPEIAALTRAIVDLRTKVDSLFREVDRLHCDVDKSRAGQPVPTNGQIRAGSVQEWLPVLDRMQELLLVEKGHADLAQTFGTYTRQRELRVAEEPSEATWTEPNESSYESL